MSSSEDVIDAHNVATRLWVGGKPPFDRELPAFDVVALCAREIQPDRVSFGGLLLRCPVPADHISTGDVNRMLATAALVSEALLSGKRVLVTCASGHNRAALVASLALSRITRMTADDLIRVMRSRVHRDAMHAGRLEELLRTLSRRWRSVR